MGKSWWSYPIGQPTRGLYWYQPFSMMPFTSATWAMPSRW